MRQRAEEKLVHNPVRRSAHDVDALGAERAGAAISTRPLVQRGPRAPLNWTSACRLRGYPRFHSYGCYYGLYTSYQNRVQ